MRRHIAAVAVALVCLSAAPAWAQMPVTDPAALVQHITRYVVEKKILTHVDEQQLSVYRAARRIVDVGVNVGRWVADGMPLWTVFSVHPDLQAVGEFIQDLNSGRRGSGYAAISATRRQAEQLLQRVSPETAAVLRAELATIDALEETALTAIEGVGRIRAQSATRSRIMRQAERDLTSSSGSTAAQLDAQSGLALLRSRQTEDTGQLLTPAVAMLVAQSKRDRDADMLTHNMRAAALERKARNQCATACGPSIDAVLRNWSHP